MCFMFLRQLFLVVTCLWVTCSHSCYCFTIDQIISRAMASPGGQGLTFDERSQTVRVELDMVFSLQAWARLIRRNSSYPGIVKRQAIHDGPDARKWPGGVVPYVIDPHDFTDGEVKMLHDAMKEWMRYTCVRFQPARPSTRQKVTFTGGDGCASHVGMVRENKVSLGEGCRMKGVVMHELGHVLGFHHEQTRPDRDMYVTIRTENIPDHLQYNFQKYTWAIIRDLGVPYDFLSIMHYGKNAFSHNGQVTIQTNNAKYQDLIGNRIGLSFRDIKSANILYNCKPGRDCHLTDDDCSGEGFVSTECTCWCPHPDRYSKFPYYVCQPGEEAGLDCQDRNLHCRAWADRGECQRNRLYMKNNCKRSCGLCSSARRACRDKYEGCDYWSRTGYCDSSSEFSQFMIKNCKKSCALCPTLPGPRGKVLPCERGCGNDNDLCQMWARRGECTATPDYMLRHCRKACGTCCTVDA